MVSIRSSATRFGGTSRLRTSRDLRSDNQRLVEVVGAMSTEQLAVRPAPDLWPVWATVGHTTGARVYWLCGVLGEPGAETTPFTDAVSGVGWEDDENIPRGARELVMALETTWRLVDRCLDRWTPAMLGEAFVREYGTTD